MKIIVNCFNLILVALLFLATNASAEEKTFEGHCLSYYIITKVCPKDICHVECKEQTNEENCEKTCVPNNCGEIPVDKCPLNYCDVMLNCAGKKTCHARIEEEKPSCGEVTYSKQDVPCCSGLVRRCGLEFLDGTCDLLGANSLYDVPICVACGDRVCSQFEDRCNCPEDCGGGEYKGFVFDPDLGKNPKN